MQTQKADTIDIFITEDGENLEIRSVRNQGTRVVFRVPLSS